MYLVTAATSFEIEPFLAALSYDSEVAHLVTGIGPVEAAVQLTAFLAKSEESFDAVVNIGVAGAYVRDELGAHLLAICLAEREILGDLGICLGNAIAPLQSESLDIHDQFLLDRDLLAKAEGILKSQEVPFEKGVFVTVNCVSGTDERGRMLALQHHALCENMEGAAVARVCQLFNLPLLELRCISNMVEKRDKGSWKLEQACICCGKAAALVVDRLKMV